MRQAHAAQGHPEPAGGAKLTAGYNLPARTCCTRWADHSRGSHRARPGELARVCYRSCLSLAAERGLRSVAFCCISTGEFHLPNQEAAAIAV
jgi:O-acetyl-ADP-ribose deacetylase (regulator of RNase III)